MDNPVAAKMAVVRARAERLEYVKKVMISIEEMRTKRVDVAYELLTNLIYSLPFQPNLK